MSRSFVSPIMKSEKPSLIAAASSFIFFLKSDKVFIQIYY